MLRLYYDRNKYNITYELNEGKTTSALINSYMYGKGLLLSSKVTKDGCEFLGWYDNQEFTGEPIIRIGTEEIGDKTFYAKWSEEQFYITSEKHDVDVEENSITKIGINTDFVTLKSNITTNGTLKKVLNLKGEEVKEDSLIGTGYKIQVDYKGTTREYEVAVRADLDGNGTTTVTDLSMLNQALVKKLDITGIKQKAADIDYNGKMTVTDLSMMNQAMVGKLNLKMRKSAY